MKLEDAIQIEAPRELVWSITTDVERWPEWTPTVRSVKRTDDGPFRVGSSARIRQPGLPECEWTVTTCHETECFTWETRTRGLHLVATHELETRANGTRNMLRIEIRGFVAAVLAPLLRPRLRRALASENAGLKRRCEQRVREHGDDDGGR